MNSKEQLTTRLVEWNIQCGGFEGYDQKTEAPRYLAEIQSGIKRLHVPFISLIDTYRWDQLYTPKDLQTMFGYSHAYCINLEDDRLKDLGHNNGITVLSNLDVEHFETIRIETRNAVKTTVNVNGGPLDIFSVYLDDVHEKTRLEQMRAILAHVKPNRKTLITGDFNCISDRDVKIVQKTVDSVIQKLPQKQKAQFYSVKEKLAHHSAIRYLEAKGFADTAEKRQPTTPTHKLSPMLLPFLRLDYAFRTPDIAVISTRVIRSKLFDQTSDHFPLVVEIDATSNH
jgi:endonuclease/exonuclease/phosphatase family metal-dependent hydrolase